VYASITPKCYARIKILSIDEYSSLFCHIVIAKRKKCFVKLTPGPNVIKHFTAVIYECYKLVGVFVPGKHFQPSLMFESKAGAYTSEAPFRCSTVG